MPLISCDEKGGHLCPLPPKAHPPIMGKTANDPKCGTAYKTPDQHPSKLSGHQRQGESETCHSPEEPVETGRVRVV